VAPKRLRKLAAEAVVNGASVRKVGVHVAERTQLARSLDRTRC